MSLEETTKLNIKNDNDDAIEKKVEPDSKPAATEEPPLWIKLRDVSLSDILHGFLELFWVLNISLPMSLMVVKQSSQDIIINPPSVFLRKTLNTSLLQGGPKKKEPN